MTVESQLRIFNAAERVRELMDAGYQKTEAVDTATREHGLTPKEAAAVKNGLAFQDPK